MTPIEPIGDTPEKGMPTYAMEVIVALLIFVMGVVVIAGSWALGSGWTSEGPGAGYFPFYIGVILCISGAGTVVQALRGAKKNADVFVNGEQLKRVLSVFLPALIYVFAVQFVGLYVASAVYIALFMAVLGKFSPIKSAVTAVLVNVLFFAMFEIWFKVPLFKGRLDPLSFLGY